MSLIYQLRVLHGKWYEFKKEKKERKQIEKEIADSKIKIYSIDETFDELEKGKSIARFGDGEMDIILGGSIGFQKPDLELGDRLHQILADKPEYCLIGITETVSTLENLTDESLKFWTKNMFKYRKDWVRILTENPNDNYVYGNAQISRCYIRYKDKSNTGRWFERLKTLWSERNIVIIEGEKTRLGCGNDFLDGAKSVKRIIGPAENAFGRIQEIEDYIINNIDKESLVLLALGPTATVLAYDLSKEGYQALDIGHCDIEYEWFRQGVKERTAVKGKYTNEIANGNIVESSLVDQKYLNEIIVEFR